MQGDWLIWVIGVPVLCLAGFATSYLARRRARALQGRSGWAAAEAAVDSARISRDAAPVANGAADDLLARAELIAADGGGPADARVAEDLAARADRLWRGAVRG